MCAGLPQDRGLGCVIDDRVEQLHANAVHVEVSRPVDCAVTLETDAVVDVQGEAALVSCTEGDWIEVSKSKGKPKGKGGRKC